jgi:esterase/lipase
VKTQQQNLLEQSFTSYLREFENTALTRKEIFQKFQTDILRNLKRISDPTSITEKDILEGENMVMDKVDELFELHVIDFCC